MKSKTIEKKVVKNKIAKIPKKTTEKTTEKITEKTAKKIKEKHDHNHTHVHEHHHPDHKVHLKQLARVKGQVEGIEKMINEGRYCVDIINQLKAVSAGLKVVESAIFDSHLQSCVNAALASKNDADIQKKMAEINKLVYGPKSKK